MANVIEAVYEAKNRMGPATDQAKRDIDRLNKALGTADSAVGQFSSRFSNALGALPGLLNPAGIAAIGVSVSIGAISLAATEATTRIKALASTAEGISNLAQKTGIAASRVQGLQQIFADMGGDAGQISQALVIFSRNVSTNSAELAAMGITATNVDDALRQVIDRFSKMEDGPAKTAEAMALFGRSGAALIPILNSGNVEIDATIQRFRELGIVLSDKKLQDLGNLDDNFDAIDARFKGLGQTLLVTLLPAFEYFTGLLIVTLDRINDIPKALDAAGKSMRDFANSLPGGKQVLDLVAIGNAVVRVRDAISKVPGNTKDGFVKFSDLDPQAPTKRSGGTKPFVDETTIQKLQRFADLFTEGLALALRPLTDSRGALRLGQPVPVPEPQLTDTGAKILENIKRGEQAVLNLSGRIVGIFNQTADQIFTGTAARFGPIVQLFVAVGDAILKTFLDVLAEITAKSLARGFISAVASFIPGFGPAAAGGAAVITSAGRVIGDAASGRVVNNYFSAIDSRSVYQDLESPSGSFRAAQGRQGTLARVF